MLGELLDPGEVGGRRHREPAVDSAGPALSPDEPPHALTASATQAPASTAGSVGRPPASALERSPEAARVHAWTTARAHAAPRLANAPVVSWSASRRWRRLWRALVGSRRSGGAPRGETQRARAEEPSPIERSADQDVLEEVGNMMILTGRTIVLGGPSRRTRTAASSSASSCSRCGCAGSRCSSRRSRSATRRRGCRRPTSSSCSARWTGSAASSCSPRSASSRRSSTRSCSPAWPAPRSPPTSARARSARSSTRWRCSASTRSRTSSSRASWR